MKIFGLFGKKNVHHVRGASAATLQPGAEARDTSKKIDAIESEMSAEFGASLPGTAPADFFDYSVSTAAVTLPQIIEEAAILFANNQVDKETLNTIQTIVAKTLKTNSASYASQGIQVDTSKSIDINKFHNNTIKQYQSLNFPLDVKNEKP